MKAADYAVMAAKQNGAQVMALNIIEDEVKRDYKQDAVPDPGATLSRTIPATLQHVPTTMIIARYSAPAYKINSTLSSRLSSDAT